MNAEESLEGLRAQAKERGLHFKMSDSARSGDRMLPGMYIGLFRDHENIGVTRLDPPPGDFSEEDFFDGVYVAARRLLDSADQPSARPRNRAERRARRRRP